MKKNVEKVWGARYTLGARYLLKNTVIKIQSSDIQLRGEKNMNGRNVKYLTGA
jgi:hypothetical protein